MAHEPVEESEEETRQRRGRKAPAYKLKGFGRLREIWKNLNKPQSKPMPKWRLKKDYEEEEG